MWPLIGLCVVALFIVWITHWTYKWRNPSCNGKLPPGSMGLPLIGETLELFIPGKSFDVPPFIKKRMKRYGPLFRTSLAGRPIVVSSDPEFNHFVFQQEGKLVQLWYMDSFAKLIGQDDTATATGYVHKYLRNLVLSHFGLETLKEKLLPKVEQMVHQSLHNWSTKESVEVKHATADMVFDLTAKNLFGFEGEKSLVNMSQKFTNFLQGLMSFPLNIPGTTFHRCLKNQKEALKIMKDMLLERRDSPVKQQEDFLDHVIEDMKTEKFLTVDFVVYMMFGLLLASFETISSTLTLAIILLTDHPAVVQELREENEAILRAKENPDSGITWKEYKSMTFTHHVINESLRIASVAPGILRKVIKDIHINGYTIPEGWTLMVVPSAIQLNPNTYEDPLAFNPWRWKDLGANLTAKNFIPFGGGMRSCAGADFSKVLMALFLHVLVTKYSWTKIKGGDVARTPALAFRNGFHIKVTEIKK
ncbi:hypothetical protein HHK36_002843 [Tetracentron sinense]|uniref:Cytochrome P450 87A3 n=1 Tax=Tetracentron sinense TaxID=13715 RepID=A0A834ZWF4_TETSI|nr:hypothetical protein HHK36_002843 [Tetracentron sinense]